MRTIRIFGLTALSLIGLTVASAQAGEWHRSFARPVCPPPVVVCPPAPCPVVAPRVVHHVHYRHAPRVIDRPGCR